MTKKAGEASFVRALLDLSFNESVTIRIARGAFVLTIAAAAAMLLGGVVAGAFMIESADRLVGPDNPLWQISPADEARRNGWLLIVASPFVSAAMVVVSRVAAETMMVIFSVAEHLRQRKY
jgi:hypothetical protein